MGFERLHGGVGYGDRWRTAREGRCQQLGNS